MTASRPPVASPSAEPASSAPASLSPTPSIAPNPRALTPEALAKQAARKAAKVVKQATAAAAVEQGRPSPETAAKAPEFLRRDWVAVGGAAGEGEEKEQVKAKILSWNLLAQCLIRRELFPGSDLLKGKDRFPSLIAELLHYSPSIACLQEVDHVPLLIPHLERVYAHTTASGPGKLHGLMILYRRDEWELVSEEVVQYDDEGFEEVEGKTAGSRRTRNVGLVVGLKRKDGRGGVVVGTTHLFWHPRFTYERTRQAALLLRHLRQFRQAHALPSSWPAILAGDFNTQPTESTYALLVGDALLPSQLVDLQASRVVHISLEKNGTAAAGDDEESGESTTTVTPASSPSSSTPTPAPAPAAPKAEQGLPDRMPLKDARPPTAADGLLDIPDLVALFPPPGQGLMSAYDSAWGTVGGEEGNDFVGRLESDEERKGMEGRKGRHEPAWTNVTPLWNLTLDYILFSGGQDMRVTGLLRTPRKEQLGGGLPRKGVSASDHVAVGAELSWSSS